MCNVFFVYKNVGKMKKKPLKT